MNDRIARENIRICAREELINFIRNQIDEWRAMLELLETDIADTLSQRMANLMSNGRNETNRPNNRNRNTGTNERARRVPSRPSVREERSDGGVRLRFPATTARRTNN